MKLSTYARDITNRARANCYATDATRASDPLIRPFGEFDELQATLKSLQGTTMALCWVNSEGKAVPFNEAEFNAVQKEIADLQGKINHNTKILDALDAKVAKLGLTEPSIGKLKAQKEKLREQINQIRAEEKDSLANKWQAVVTLGGNRGMYDALPEVQEARAKAAAQIEPIEAEILALNGQIRSLEAILSKFKR